MTETEFQARYGYQGMPDSERAYFWDAINGSRALHEATLRVYGLREDKKKAGG